MELVKKVRIVKKKRKFTVGKNNDIKITHKADIVLKDNEMVSFFTKNKKQYDITKKDWGFYLSQSIHHRVLNEGFKIAIVKNKIQRKYLMAVDIKKINNFKKYCEKEKLLLRWFK